jgi:hypothetical protein
MYTIFCFLVSIYAHLKTLKHFLNPSTIKSPIKNNIKGSHNSYLFFQLFFKFKRLSLKRVESLDVLREKVTLREEKKRKKKKETTFGHILLYM